ncbi:MAG: hypothetical protein IPK26_31840 [Planctomycetes bacterium]|nr:hypothetical protein [Planctomycetota bacterium]
MVKSLLFVCALQQLTVTPYPAEVGDSVVVQAMAPSGPLAGLPIERELPDGSRVAIGSTGSDGVLRHDVAVAGTHIFRARHGEVALVTPLAVREARPRWPLALACVPLGLALGWRHLRDMRREAAARARLSCTGSGSSGSH